MKRLVLAGGGHSQLFVLESLAHGALKPLAAGLDVVLVAPSEEHFYSGMIPGVVAGQYDPGEARFDLPALARAAGARFIRAGVVRVDADARRLHLVRRPHPDRPEYSSSHGGSEAIPYDLLSLCIGSRPADGGIRGWSENSVPVRPMAAAAQLRQRAIEAVSHRSGSRESSFRCAVIGGGAAGFEVALCLQAALERRARGASSPGIREARSPGLDEAPPAFTIVSAAPRILADYPEALSAAASRILAARGVELITDSPVAAIEPGRVVFASSRPPLDCDLVVGATGPAAPELAARSGLPADGRGYLRVDSTLRVPGRPEIFGAGDCATLDEHPWVPRAGVYAVREGPVLAANLAAALGEGRVRSYEPQRLWLSLLNTGDGRALLSKGRWLVHARWAWWLKDAIDRRFMRRFGAGDDLRGPAGGD